jgi:hypothetical protein
LKSFRILDRLWLFARTGVSGSRCRRSTYRRPRYREQFAGYRLMEKAAIPSSSADRALARPMLIDTP